MKLTNTMRDAFVRAVMADVPRVDYVEKIREAAIALAVEKLPAEVRKLWKNAELRGFVKTSQYYIHDQYYWIPGDNTTPLRDAIRDATDELDKQNDAQSDAHKELRLKVKAIAYSVSTRKALAELMPEFAKYLPSDESAALRTVPVVQNVVADFVKAGWPKDGKSRAKAVAA